MHYKVIIPAAGQGKRMGAGFNKQLIEINNKPLIVHTLEVFERHAYCSGIILAINPLEEQIFTELISKYSLKKIESLVHGGKERQDSIYNALKIINSDNIVLVHDGARPFIEHKLIEKLILAAEEFKAAIPAVMVKDTIKIVKNNFVTSTPNRSELYAVQTPQAFNKKILLDAYKDAYANNYYGTDDSSLVEKQGVKVKIVDGDYNNIKITTPEDLITAENFINRRITDV
jgi:2-C-methyl-D-erythritol 4-phosphate cytidylyltransferase